MQSSQASFDGLLNLTRWFDHIQHLPEVRAAAESPALVAVDPSAIDVKAPNKQAAAASAAAAGEETEAQRKQREKAEKKEKAKAERKKAEEAAAAAAAAAAAEPMAMLDIRVGRIVEVWPHPDSDKCVSRCRWGGV